MSRPDKSRRQPGHDAPRANPHGASADRAHARHRAAASEAAPGHAADQDSAAAPAGESSARVSAPTAPAGTHASSPPAQPGGETTPAVAEAGHWDDWERELAAQAHVAGRRDAGADDTDHDDEDATDTAAGPAPDESRLQRVRIDKWLWAARFFRTRSLAKEALEGGKVHCDGQRVKVSKDVRVGMTLDIRQGFDEKTVVVKALSEVRGAAAVAQRLYEETVESVAAREQLQANRRAQNLAHPDHRPNKKDRRQIHRFKDSWQE